VSTYRTQNLEMTLAHLADQLRGEQDAAQRKGLATEIARIQRALQEVIAEDAQSAVAETVVAQATTDLAVLEAQLHDAYAAAAAAAGIVTNEEWARRWPEMLHQFRLDHMIMPIG